MAKLKLWEIAVRIQKHLKRFEKDPKINTFGNSYQTAAPYHWPTASASGNRIIVKEVSYHTTGSSLTKAEATDYLAWLDEGNVGQVWKWREMKIKGNEETDPPIEKIVTTEDETTTEEPINGISTRDIPQFTGWGNYAVHVPWAMLLDFLERWQRDMGLDLDPDFQRGYVWTLEQKIRFVEYGLRGGKSGMDILLNCPGWQGRGDLGDFVLVDGKQRISAVFGFLNNEFPVFGEYYFKDFVGGLDPIRQRFYVHVNDLETRGELLEWYLDLNSGGTVHTEEDLNKVRRLIEEERNKR
jgi:hypothetical protein